MRYLIIIIALIVLAGCEGVAQYSANCTGDDEGGYDCTDVSVHPYQPPPPLPTATPYPPTVGTYTLGTSFDSYLEDDTDISWSILSSPGPAHLIDYNRSAVLAVTQPGDYVIEARWVYSQTEYYTHPFTLTVELPPLPLGL